MDTPFSTSSQVEAITEATAGLSAEQTSGVASVSPPSGNTGGKLWRYEDPNTGESFLICPKGDGTGNVNLIPLPAEGSHPYAAITDYLNCTFPFDPSKEPLEGLFQELFQVLGSQFSPAIDRQRGLHGYKRSFDLGDSKGQLAIGGQSGTVLISLPGEACTLITNWNRLITYFRDTRHGRITRWDGAVDDYEGIHSVDYAVELYLAGQFSAGGNMPSHHQSGAWIKPDGSGRTFYIGKRNNGKMLRVYEKGMQLGGIWHPWVRWEVEMHNKDRVIPWEVLTEPGPYFVGSYPKALSWVQKEMSRIQTIKKQTGISYEHLASYASIAYGPLLNVMLEVEGSPEAVLKRLHREGTPKRLQHPFIHKASDYLKKEATGSNSYESFAMGDAK